MNWCFPAWALYLGTGVYHTYSMLIITVLGSLWQEGEFEVSWGYAHRKILSQKKQKKSNQIHLSLNKRIKEQII